MRPILFTFAFLLVGCGGGGGGGSPAQPPPVVVPPEEGPAEIIFTRDLNAGLRRAFGGEPESDIAFSSGGVAASE
ncbi:MAG TPA: hypothetical protein DCM54_01935, partial [Gammaproteobacteria bacterium]|nr:hypothetical protein [Gammaproteobacteria bacterium]